MTNLQIPDRRIGKAPVSQSRPEGPPRATLVLVAASLQSGGAERQMVDMANYWAAKGLNVILATWSGPPVIDFYELDHRVHRSYLHVDAEHWTFLAKLTASLRRVFKLRKLLITSRANTVLSFLTANNVLTILAATGLETRVVISERVHPPSDSTIPLSWRLLRRALYAWADIIVAQTRAAAHWIQENCHKETLVIPNALRPLVDVAEDRQKLILAVGRLVHQKGYDLLLRAFARVEQEFPDWSITVIGEGREHERLLRLTDELALADRVNFLGQVRDVERWMACAGLVVQPSRYEGFPNVVLEAMGMGATVISADCPAGPAELIEDHVNGRLVPVENVAVLAEVMAELMRQPEVRSRLGREALKVRQRFGQDAIMERWDSLLLEQSGLDNATYLHVE